jgi:hypothetical protein
VMNIAVSTLVISQLLRMARLNCLTPQLFRLFWSGMVQTINWSRRRLLGDFAAKLAIVRCRSFELFPKSLNSGKASVDVGIANQLGFQKSTFQKWEAFP